MTFYITAVVIFALSVAVYVIFAHKNLHDLDLDLDL